MAILLQMVYMDYVISYTPDVPGAKEQHTTFKIQIDTQNLSSQVVIFALEMETKNS